MYCCSFEAVCAEVGFELHVLCELGNPEGPRIPVQTKNSSLISDGPDEEGSFKRESRVSCLKHLSNGWLVMVDFLEVGHRIKSTAV